MTEFGVWVELSVMRNLGSGIDIWAQFAGVVSSVQLGHAGMAHEGWHFIMFSPSRWGRHALFDTPASVATNASVNTAPYRI